MVQLLSSGSTVDDTRLPQAKRMGAGVVLDYRNTDVVAEINVLLVAGLM